MKKHTKYGVERWEPTYAIGAVHFIDVGIDLEVDADENVYVAATIEDDVSGYDVLCIKYDSNGTELWNRTYNNPTNDNDIPSSIDVDNLGNVYLTGKTKNTGTSGDDIFVLKYNSTGNLQWSKQVDYFGKNDGGIRVRYQSTGNIEVLAITSDNSGVFELSKYLFNGSGTQLSDNRTNVGSSLKVLNDIVDDGNGGYYAGGAVENVNGDLDVAVYHFNSNLSTDWSYTYDENGYDDEVVSIEFASGSGIYFGAMVRETPGIANCGLFGLTTTGVLDWNFVDRAENSQNILNISIVDDCFFAVGKTSLANKDIETVWKVNLSNGKLNDNFYFNEQQSILGGDIFPIDSLCFLKSLFTTNEVVTERVSLYRENRNTIKDTTNKIKFIENQLVISFQKDFIDTSLVNNSNILFGSVYDFLLSSAVDSLQNYFGSRIDFDKVVMTKVFKRLPTKDSVSLSRQGRYKKIPAFWTIFEFDFNQEVEEIALREAFTSDSLSLISFSQLNHKIKFRSWTPDDPDFVNQHALTQDPTSTFDYHIHMEEAWSIEKGDSKIRVGVLDGAADWAHQDFDLITNNTGFENSKIKGGYDYARMQPISMTNRSRLLDFHGTSVAGVIGAYSNNGNQVSGVAGGDESVGNPGVQLFNSVAVIKESAAAEAVMELAKNDPDADFPGYGNNIINISLGFGEDGDWFGIDKYPLVTDAIRFAKNQGVSIICAAENFNTKHKSYPDGYHDDWVIKVSSSSNDNQRYLGRFIDEKSGSAFGVNLDLLAPGCEDCHEHLLEDGDGTHSSVGTSFAAPLVSGVAALMLSHHNQGQSASDNRNLFPDDVEWLLQQSAQDLSYNLSLSAYDGEDATIGYDEESGWGKLRADYALKMLVKPNCELKHYFNTVSSSSLIASDVYVTFLDYYFESGTDRIIRKDKEYKVDVYEVKINVSAPWPTWHAGTYSIVDDNSTLSTDNTFEIFERGVWPLNSSSNVWYYDAQDQEAQPFNNVKFETEPYKDGNQMKAVVVGHVFYVKKKKNSLKNVNEWLPHKSDEEHNLDFSILYSLNWDLGVDDLNNLVEIYPNPVEDILNIKTSSTSIQSMAVYDISGKEVTDKKRIDTKSTQLNLSALTKGVYILKVVTNGHVITKKVSVE